MDIVKDRQHLCDNTSDFSDSITVKNCAPAISIGPTRINDDRLGAVGVLFSIAIDPTDTNTMYVSSHISGV